MYLKCIVCGVFSHELVRKTSSSVSVLPTLSWALTLRVRSFTKLATGRSNGVGPAQKQVHAINSIPQYLITASIQLSGYNKLCINIHFIIAFN